LYQAEVTGFQSQG
jgi:hypothetical protein